MTATEWLHDKWSNCKEWKWEEIEQWFEQAKEMERSQMIEFAKNLPLKSGLLQEGGTYCERGNVEEYYNKVYGGSVVSEEVKGTSTQTEISDEEIEKLANDFLVDYEKVGVTQWEVSAFIMGMKEYREQLKSRQ